MLCMCTMVQAQTSSDPLTLRNSPWLQEEVQGKGTNKTKGQNNQPTTTQITADRMYGQVDKTVIATGKVEVRRPDAIIRGDNIHYDVPSDTVNAKGQVRINRLGNVYGGDEVNLQIDSSSGTVDKATFSFLQGGAGSANKLELIDDKHTIAYDALYSSCRPDGQQPTADNADWYVRGKRVIVDTETGQGYAEKGALVFKNVPIVPLVGGARFPLGNRRVSGLLPPTASYSNTQGLTYTQPYYFNIAPNRDATVAPTIMSRRGVGGGAQFRYLEDSYSGSLDTSVLFNDRLRDGDKRWQYHYLHTQNIPAGKWGNFALSLDMQRVSDDWYWYDFTTFASPVNSSSSRTLPSTAQLNWGLDNWSAYLKHQTWQTLQQPSPITPPYNMEPQLHARYARYNLKGFDVALDLDSTRFVSDSTLTGYPNGTRSYALGSVSYPMDNAWGYITPTAQLHASHYSTSSAMGNGTNTATRVLPTFSVDSGMVFERDTQLFNRKMVQTLEPRLFLAYTQYRDQSYLPNYDTSVRSFSMSSIFSANPFIGNDRIADTRSATGGITSRFYDSDTGEQVASVSAAARHQFTDQRVLLNAGDSLANYSYNNLLFEGTLNWSPTWGVNGMMQWDPGINRSIRSTLGAFWNPGPYRTISANYTLQRDPLTPTEQIDVGWQWPLNDLWGDKGKDLGVGRGQGAPRWYSVGRLYYSKLDSKFVNAITGIEYDSCCWIGRVLFQRKQVSTTPERFDNRVMVQLELKGFSRIGSGVTQTLRDYVPNYTPLYDRNIMPSRFENYDN